MDIKGTKWRNPTVLAIAVLLAGCGSGNSSAPTGQVVVTVDGTEITKAQLDAEIGDFGAAATPEQRLAMQRAAIQRLVVRQLLADYAKEKKLDQSPTGAILKQRGEANSLAELVQRDIRSNLPKVSKEEVQIFLSDHPSKFSQRKIYVVDQYIVRDAGPALLKEIEPLNTMDAIASLLTQKNIPFVQTIGLIDTMSIDDAAAEKIAAMAPGTVFVVPQGGSAGVNRIREVANVPLTGVNANLAAEAMLRAQRGREMIQTQLQGIIGQGMSKVKFNPAFAPPPAPQKAAQQQKPLPGGETSPQP